nr:hypothetical protein [Tanacetum cinerariifolium]
MTNPEDIIDLTTAMNMALALMAKAFKLNYPTLTNNNQRISSNPRNRQIAQPGMNMGQDRQMQMIGGNDGNQFRQYAGQNARNLNGYNEVQNVGNQNQIRNGNLVAARANGNAAGPNGNQISQIAQSGVDMDQDRQMLMIDDNVGNRFRQNAVQNVGNLVRQNAVQNQGIQNVGTYNGLSVISEIANQPGNGNVVAARAEGNGNGINGNPIRCYICQGVDHYASNCTLKPRKRDAAYLQKQMQNAQKEEACIQLTFEEFDFMAAAGACEETERANANCTLENNLQQASTSGTKSDKAPVYDSNRTNEVHLSKNCHDNDIFNMFTQEEQYTKLLKPIPKPHQVQQNDSNVISAISSVEQGGRTVEQHYATVAETRAYHESLFHNLAAEVEKVNSVNRKM